MTTKSWAKADFPRKSLNDGSSDWWTASGSGTNEYYYNQADIVAEPLAVFADGIELLRGTAGSLNANEWDFADNDSIGEKRIYVRIDGSDPDSKAAGYMECSEVFTLIDEGSGKYPVVVGIIFSNLSGQQATVLVYKTAGDDTVEFKAKLEIPGDNSPVDWLTKIFLNELDKLKIQSDTVDVSAILSGDA